MELKVWVEGIQRIVCGVNEKTTCQDVVFALAHATGKTGRFTLIERWRNSERLLAPNEQPLKVLLKWGEHSNDVQFILQWSPLDSSSSSNKSGQLQQSGKPQLESSCSDNDNSSTHSPSPLSKSSTQPFTTPSSNSNTAIGESSLSPLTQVNGPLAKKASNSGSSSSYTSNDSRLWSPFSHTGPESLSNNFTIPSDVVHNNGVSNIGTTMRGLHQNQTTTAMDPTFYSSHSSSNDKDHGSSMHHSQSSGKLTDPKLSSPPPYREPPSPAFYPATSTTPSGLNSPGLKCLPPYREPPPPNLPPTTSNTNKSSSSNLSGNTISSVSSRNQVPVFSQGNINNVAHSNTNGSLNGSVHNFSAPNEKDLIATIARHSGPVSFTPSQQDSHSISSSVNSGREVDGWNLKRHSLINGDGLCENGSVPPKTSHLSSHSSNSNSNYRELIRVVNTQREKLTSQQAELTQFDAEIMFWEGKSREQQKHVDMINKEISRLEVVSAQQESQVLSLAHLEEESDYAQRESVALKSEINILRTELEKCDDEMEECKKRIRILMEELHLTQQQMTLRQHEWHEKESSALGELDRLHMELDIARRETEATQDLSGNLDQEVQSIEASLIEKKKQMERLVAAMKEANLQSLSIQPPDDLIEVHQRSGSTRRMIGSPRQLENAAPTSKNPHGVWV